nr:serine carboxypeptidase-like 18 isoform X2 [Ipomoea batatas]
MSLRFVTQWLLDHPKFLSNPLYIAGDSYAGIIVPLIVREIYDGSYLVSAICIPRALIFGVGLESGIEPHQNLKGYVEGNPVTDQYADPIIESSMLIEWGFYQTIYTRCGNKFKKVFQSFTISIESEKSPRKVDPLLLWLTGGPGLCGRQVPITDKYADPNSVFLKYAYRMGLLSDNLYKNAVRKKKLQWRDYMDKHPRKRVRYVSNDLQRVSEVHRCGEISRSSTVFTISLSLRRAQKVTHCCYGSLVVQGTGLELLALIRDGAAMGTMGAAPQNDVLSPLNYANSTGEIPSLELNQYAWTKLAYDFLIQWLLDNPKFLSNPLYIAGDSYTGIIIPQIVRKIYDGKLSLLTLFSVGAIWMQKYGVARANVVVVCLFLVNVLFMIVEMHFEHGFRAMWKANPTTDKYADLNNRVVYAHRMGLLSDNLYECTEKINPSQILEPICSNESLLSLNGNSMGENLTSLLLLQQNWCRETIREWVRCNESLVYEFDGERTEAYIYDVQSTVDYHKSFTNKSCRVLIYSGDHDMVVPHLSTEEWIESLEVGVEDEWRPWFVDDQVAGWIHHELFAQNEYELTYATVKGAGHTAPEYKPQQCLSMFQNGLVIFDYA